MMSSVSSVMAKMGNPNGAAISSASTPKPSKRDHGIAQASLPSRPPGRTISTSSITRYMKASAKSGA